MLTDARSSTADADADPNPEGTFDTAFLALADPMRLQLIARLAVDRLQRLDAVLTTSPGTHSTARSTHEQNEKGERK
ncbi:MAG: hypothetical protein JWQ43_126 [Glaciihabitans sp.]|nr:hypothetical protein [Glaciihabitans sp.]